MTAQLIPLQIGSTPSISVSRPVILIGRHPECDVRLDSPQISRRHCCVALAYDRLLIRDLGSRNGVRVNGRLVEEIQLIHGDEVAIAHFIYRLDAPKPAAVAVAPVAKPKRAEPAPIIDLDDEDELISLED